ncbi:hypothetical protein ACOSQ4_013704 [Xanthoceras sorbifolium]
MNARLDAPFSEEEVKKALFQIYPSKAPSPDDMPALFFQRFWDVVGPDVTRTCLRFLNDGGSLGQINSTLITLILKIKVTLRVSDYRPISLCNVIYKIISKVLSNRFRVMLGDVISKVQSVFLLGRLIMDNAIIGFECIHRLWRHRLGNNGYLALKLDMLKAYDRVEWQFRVVFAVKSGYWFSQDSLKRPSCSDGSAISALWKLVWHLNVPPKIRFFVWRDCHNWLPSCANLVRHGVPVKDLCPLCFKYKETTFHCLWGCASLAKLKLSCLPSYAIPFQLRWIFFYFVLARAH